MISFFRRALSSWMALGVLGLVLIAFIVTGVEGPGAFSGGATGAGAVVAEAGDTKIRSRDLIARVNNQFDTARREQPGLTREAFLASGAFEGITEGLISAYAVEGWGREQGFAISKRLVDARIASMPAFRGVTGQFDATAMREALGRAGVSEKELRADIASELIRLHILTPVAADVRPPAKLAKPYADVLIEEREGLVAILPFAQLAETRQPGDAEISAAYRANIADYTRPEARVLRYALFGSEQVAARTAPTEEEIAEYYRENSAVYGALETRDLTQVIAPDEAKARTIAAAARSGGSLAEAAAKAGLEAVALGQQNRNGYAGTSSAAIAGQVFSAPRGGVIGPVKGSFGWYVVRVDEITNTPGRSLAQARPEIVAALTKLKSDEALAELSGKIEDDIADGASFAEIVAKNKLTIVETPPVLSTGQAVDKPEWQAPAELSALLKTGFEAGADSRPTLETVTEGKSYALLSVARVIPPAPLPLAEIRTAVARDIILKRAGQRAETLAKQLVAAVGRGVPLAKAVADSGAKLPAPAPARARQIDMAQAQQRGMEVPPPVRALFTLQKGKATITRGDQGDVLFVTMLTDVKPGEPAAASQLLGQTQQELSRSMAAELGEQFMRAVQIEVGVERRPEAISAAKRQFAGAQ